MTARIGTSDYPDQDAEPTANAPDDLRPTGPDLSDHRPTLVRWTQTLESMRWLDGIQQPLHRVAGELVSQQRWREALHGHWLGHAVHPLLTDVPLGLWMSSTVLDLIGGRRSRAASRRLLAAGVVTALPTAVTGLAEWAETTGPERRVGFVHAVGNTAALTLYGASLAARYRSRHTSGVLLGIAGGAVAAASGYLGGHLTLARKVSSRHPAFARDDAGARRGS